MLDCDRLVNDDFQLTNGQRIRLQPWHVSVP